MLNQEREISILLSNTPVFIDSPRFLRMIFPRQNDENTMLVFALFRHVCARIRDKLPKSFDKNFLLKYEADYENNVNACGYLNIRVICA